MEVRAEIKKVVALALATEDGEEQDITHNMPLEKFISMACQFDNAMFLAEVEKKGYGKRETTVQRRIGTVSVPQEEKDRRIKEGLCIKCREGKHQSILFKTGWWYEEKEAKGRLAEVDSSDLEKD